MLELARRRVAAIAGAAARVRFVAGDARAVALPTAGYDLVVTNFFLDCFPADQMGIVIDRVAGACAGDAVWVDGDFREPPAGVSRVAARYLLAGMYAFFRLATRIPARRLVDPAPFLTARGFALRSEATRLRGFLSSRLWARGQAH